MAITDYRYDPFLDTFNVKAIYDEEHTIPTSSPYTVRLDEVPQKTSPTTISVEFEDGTALTEVSATPSSGQYWPDYYTADDWNTGTLQFSSDDAGKVVLVSYNGLGTLVDDRLADMAEFELTSSTQPERETVTSSADTYDSTAVVYEDSDYTAARYYTYTTTRGRFYVHKGVTAGTFTLAEIIQKLVNLSHYHELVKETYYYNCDCDCTDDSGGGG